LGQVGFDPPLSGGKHEEFVTFEWSSEFLNSEKKLIGFLVVESLSTVMAYSNFCSHDLNKNSVKSTFSL